MANRPEIPIDVTRAILVEAGHRCAVCGTPCPLERAHIIPWSKSNDHSAENLICLCANCHTMADTEPWDVKTLREYKERPWIMRQNVAPSPTPKKRMKVILKVDMEVDDFDASEQRYFTCALAGFLQKQNSEIEILAIEPGSVKVTVLLAPEDAHRILSDLENEEPEIRKFLTPLKLISVDVVAGELDEPASAQTSISRLSILLEWLLPISVFAALISAPKFWRNSAPPETKDSWWDLGDTYLHLVLCVYLTLSLELRAMTWWKSESKPKLGFFVLLGIWQTMTITAFLLIPNSFVADIIVWATLVLFPFVLLTSRHCLRTVSDASEKRKIR